MQGEIVVFNVLLTPMKEARFFILPLLVTGDTKREVVVRTESD